MQMFVFPYAVSDVTAGPSEIPKLEAERRRGAGGPRRYRRITGAPATIRTQVLTCGAILGRAGRRLVIHLSRSWGGLQSRTPLLDSILACEFAISPKLVSVLET